MDEECKYYPDEPLILPPQKRVIAMGDIHGQLDLAVDMFKLAKLINDKFEWIADPPETVVIQVGDQIDSCRPTEKHSCRKKIKGDKAEDLSVLDFFDKMKKKAMKKGGNVFSLIGNHELLNVNGDFRYVSYEDYYNFKFDGKKGPKAREEAFKPGGKLAVRIACSRKSVMIIGSSIFIHGGILPVMLEELDKSDSTNIEKLEFLNRLVRKWILGKMEKTEYVKKILSDQSYSPFWTRIYGNIPNGTNINDGDCGVYLKKVLNILKIGHMVVGHTPQNLVNHGGVNGTCYQNGYMERLFRVDGGFSKAFLEFSERPPLQVLEIKNDKDFKIITEFNKVVKKNKV